uniref:Adenylyl cyclase-associated protein n=1 Tax=Hydra viridissima TaxID=6082 RepID=CAP_HYDVD|nr:RecName: Full=Adenylyl cyclase-associated protein; Short=CAP [Hydra viridissima]CAA56104.1 cyclase associated protein [Hydra viridissima]
MEQLVSRLEAVTNRLEAVASRGGGSTIKAAVDDDPAWFDDFKVFNAKFLSGFVNDTIALGGELEQMGKFVNEAFHCHLVLMEVAARHNRPSQTDLEGLLKPLSEAISKVQDFREKNRSSKQFNHLSAISEGLPFLGWVGVAPKPVLYIQQMEESAQFYTNKLLKEFRESDPKQANWATSFIQLLKGFAAYVKDHHQAGLMWNKEKSAATPAALAVSAHKPPVPPPPSGFAPPPPPPIQAPTVTHAVTGSHSSEDSRSQLFAQLSKGSEVTAGLKKVTDDMKTHKNPELRNQPPLKSSALDPRPYTPPNLKKFSAPVSKPAKKPALFQLQNKKWVIENQDGNTNLEISECNDKQTVYMYKCHASKVHINGKVNSIILDSCEKCVIEFTDVISTFEFTNCKACKVQIDGFAPTISIEKTDGAQVFINPKCLESQIVTAKSSEMNICVMKPDGDLTEYPLPEQFKTVWNPATSKFITTTMDLNL